jgi:hypothetical protein
MKVMEHAHDLYLNAVKFLDKGNKQSLKQSDIADGITFYNKQWTLRQKINLVKNFSQLKKQSDNGSINAKRKDIKTIDIKQT